MPAIRSERRRSPSQGVAELDRLGEQGWLSTVAGWAAEALYRLRT